MSQRFIALLCFASVAFSLSCSDLEDCPEPELDLKIVEGHELVRSDEWGNPTKKPYIAEETYIRTLPSSKVEIIYREDDEIIVQTYEVVERSTTVVSNLIGQ